MKRTIIAFLILIACGIWLLINIFRWWGIFTRPYDEEYYGKLYSESQYVVGASLGNGIGDDGLYAFAGNYYAEGGDPTQVNFEHPPLGKYLIGWSINFFNNENVIYLLYALVVLATVYVLGHQQLGVLPGAVCVLLLSISKLFMIQFLPSGPEQASVTLLDLPQTMFFLLGIWALTRGKGKRIAYFCSSLFFGLSFVSKFFPALLLLLPVCGWYVYTSDRKHIRLWLISLMLVPIVYFVSYAAFLQTHSLVDFMAFNRYLISWRLGNPKVVGNIMQTVLSGKYRSWWGDGLIADHEWTLDLPIMLGFAFIGSFMAIRQKHLFLTFVSLLVWGYFIYVFVGTVGVARYLVPIYPLCVLLSIYAVQKLIALGRQRLSN